jgi:hypothetical protein
MFTEPLSKAKKHPSIKKNALENDDGSVSGSDDTFKKVIKTYGKKTD